MMNTDLVSLVTFCSALGSGLIAGVFFAFSTFVMPALACLPPMQGIAAMQSINVAALNRWFLVYTTGVGRLVAPGDPDGSALFQRLQRSTTFEPRMPPLGTETTDPAAVALLRRWIQGLR